MAEWLWLWNERSERRRRSTSTTRRICQDHEDNGECINSVTENVNNLEKLPMLPSKNINKHKNKPVATASPCVLF